MTTAQTQTRAIPRQTTPRQARPPAGDRARQRREQLKCKRSLLYFVDGYVPIYDAVLGAWIPFRLWAAQADTLRAMQQRRLVVILKARQIGVTWLALAYALWLLLFHPAATVLLFSRRDDEAKELLDERLKGMYRRLPRWLQSKTITTDSKHEFALGNGSRALAFPTSGGDAYTATLAIADEFDLVPDQGRLLNSIKPTIDNGGGLILLSRPDKRRPQTPFKAIYQAARAGTNSYYPVFLPWFVHPDRDETWYAVQKADMMSQAGATREDQPGALDDLHEQYPATDAEALAARTGDKRLAAAWLKACYAALDPLPLPENAPSIPGLRLYQPPAADGQYVIGMDPAEGNPTSDDSALKVLDKTSGEEAASLAGKFQPSTLAAHADAIGAYYHRAAVLVERNNHGHAVLLWLNDYSRLPVLKGFDGKPGWNSSTRGKTLLYDIAADALRHGETTLHGLRAFTQLSSIEGSTLRAPEGELDDEADAYALALAAIVTPQAAHPDWDTVVS